MKRKIEMTMTVAAFATVIALTVITPKTGLATNSSTSDDLYLFPKMDDLMATTELTAKRRKRQRADDANGNVVSRKTGARARVAAKYAVRFQSYVDDIESTGAEVKFMGGIRPGHCSTGHRHPCGMALDVCQLSRGRVDASCHLPNRVVLGAIALKNGLFEGGFWCDNDYGHAQVGISAEACAHNIYAAAKNMVTSLVAKAEAKDVDPEAKVYDYSQVVAVNDPDEKPKVRVAQRHHRRYARTYSARSHRRVHYGYGYQPQPTYYHYAEIH